MSLLLLPFYTFYIFKITLFTKHFGHYLTKSQFADNQRSKSVRNCLVFLYVENNFYMNIFCWLTELFWNRCALLWAVNFNVYEGIKYMVLNSVTNIFVKMSNICKADFFTNFTNSLTTFSVLLQMVFVEFLKDVHLFSTLEQFIENRRINELASSTLKYACKIIFLYSFNFSIVLKE